LVLALAVRVLVRIKIAGCEVESVALVNSGFETETPQILIPVKMLIENNIDVSALKGSSVEYGTPAGNVSMYVVRRGCTISVIEPDRVVGEVISDLVISPIEREVLISDALGEELGIEILSLKRGFWRFKDDPPNTIRNSHRPQLW
jgi:hypothetical protein